MTIVLAVIKVQVQLKTYKRGILVPKISFCALLLDCQHLVLHSIRPASRMTQILSVMASQEDPVVIDDDNDWPNTGPQNPEEVRAYQDRINKIFDDFTLLLKEDQKDALPITIRTLKQVISRHWPSMANTDPDLVIRAIKDHACLHLQQEVMPCGAKAVDLEEDIPSSYEFLHQLPEQKHKAEEKALIITTLHSISEDQAHMSMTTTNLSSLVKITDPETFKLVLRAMVHPMVQLNIPPRFLDPVWDPEPMSAADQ